MEPEQYALLARVEQDHWWFRGMRRLVLGHSVLAFFFNLAILGLSINIAASVINS